MRYVRVAEVARGVKAKTAPASRSIMQHVTHATLLHCEPCYASAGQGGPRIYGGIFSGNREMRGIVAAFISTGGLRRVVSLQLQAAAKAIGFDVLRKY